jgi:hypothetical protein
MTPGHDKVIPLEPELDVPFGIGRATEDRDAEF